MYATVFRFTPTYPVMAANSELMKLATAAIGEGVTCQGVQRKLVRSPGGDAQDALHHPFPFFPVRRDAAKVFPDQ